MIQVCKYDPKRDIKPVQPGLAMDLAKAIETGEVLATASVDEYNKFEVEQIGETIRDNFSAMDAGNTLASTDSVNPSGESD